jgi:DNA-binding transcriptional LysR family regulator
MNIDLKHLAMLNELYKTKSVSRAADNLGVSQPTISVTLAKLRKHFSDSFFVRTSDGMVPTPLALEIINRISVAYGTIQTALAHHVSFDPATSDRSFRLCASDIFQAVTMPGLLQFLSTVAPRVRIELRDVSRDTARLLEVGKIDLAVGLTPKLGAGFSRQRLYTEGLVCALRADHPRIKSRLTIESYQEEMHIETSIPGAERNVASSVLDAQGLRRMIGMRTHNWLGLAYLLPNTTYLATVPERLGKILARQADIAILPLPFESPTFTIHQHWNQRYSEDPANSWLRNVLRQISHGPQPAEFETHLIPGLRSTRNGVAAPQRTLMR